MAWTYGDDPGTTTAAQLRDATRLAIGDTDTTDQQLSDAKVDWALDIGGDDWQAAAIRCCRWLIAKYARQANTTHGKLSVAAGERADHYRLLLADLQTDSEGLATPFAGGQTISGKDALAEDTDAIQPQFEIGRDDFPGTGAPGSIYDGRYS